MSLVKAIVNLKSGMLPNIGIAGGQSGATRGFVRGGHIPGEDQHTRIA